MSVHRLSLAGLTVTSLQSTLRYTLKLDGPFPDSSRIQRVAARRPLDMALDLQDKVGALSSKSYRLPELSGQDMQHLKLPLYGSSARHFYKFLKVQALVTINLLCVARSVTAVSPLVS